MPVLERVGGFIEIGTCRSDRGELEVVYRRDITDAGYPIGGLQIA